MESRVMGNCHARFGVGEKVNSGADAPLKTLPITILHYGGDCTGEQETWFVPKILVRCPQSSDFTVGV